MSDSDGNNSCTSLTSQLVILDFLLTKIINNMKKLFLLLTFCTAALCVSASNRYVSPTGDNGDGKSWEHALQSVATALSGRGVGDTVFVAEGVYLEQVSIGDGVTLLGGYDAGSGVRDPELYESVLDGTGLTKWILVKYGGNADNTITIDGMVFQNANHSEWGGAAIYCRGNMVISNCVFRNNTSGSKMRPAQVQRLLSRLLSVVVSLRTARTLCPNKPLPSVVRVPVRLS